MLDTNENWVNISESKQGDKQNWTNSTNWQTHFNKLNKLTNHTFLSCLSRNHQGQTCLFACFVFKK